MTKKSDVHKCGKCGCIVAVLQGGEGNLDCCGQQMKEVTPDEARRLTHQMARPGAQSDLDFYDIRAMLLFFPDKAANWLLQKRYPSPAETATMPLAALDEIYQADGDEASRRHIRELIASAPPPTTVESDPDSPTPPTTASSTPPPRRHIDQNSEWGVTSAEGARAYSTSGKFIGRLPVGTVMEINDIRQSPKGDLASCTLGNPVAGMPAQVLIKSKDLTTWRGALADVSPQERKLRGDQASLQANIESRVVAIGKGHEQRNPNNAAYQSALSNYRDVYKRSEALKKLRDSTTGVKRQEAANKLKQMKGEGAAVSRKYEAIKIDYEAWKRSNPPPSANDDKTILRLRRRVDQIDDEIRRLDV